LLGIVEPIDVCALAVEIIEFGSKANVETASKVMIKTANIELTNFGFFTFSPLGFL
jgi:hypothetical protein